MTLHDCQIVLALYVDDIVFVGDNINVINNVKDAFKHTFKMKDLGDLEYYLGMRITRTPETLKIDQSQYAVDVVTKFSRWMSQNPNRYRKQVPFYRDLKLTKSECILILVGY